MEEGAGTTFSTSWTMSPLLCPSLLPAVPHQVRHVLAWFHVILHNNALHVPMNHEAVDLSTVTDAVRLRYHYVMHPRNNYSLHITITYTFCCHSLLLFHLITPMSHFLLPSLIRFRPFPPLSSSTLPISSLKLLLSYPYPLLPSP